LPNFALSFLFVFNTHSLLDTGSCFLIASGNP
jgi:hypothetical protein